MVGWPRVPLAAIACLGSKVKDLVFHDIEMIIGNDDGMDCLGVQGQHRMELEYHASTA